MLNVEGILDVLGEPGTAAAPLVKHHHGAVVDVLCFG